MQKQIDEALGEVRREKAVIAKQMETISLLAKLRKVRFNARHTRGEQAASYSTIALHCAEHQTNVG